MKFKISQQQFAQALTFVGKAIASRTTLPVLSGVYMDLEGNRLTMLGNNTEIAAKTVLDVRGEEDGIFIVPARLLTDFVSTLSAGEITIETTEKVLRATIGKTKSDFTGLGSEEYPEINFDQQATVYQLPLKNLVDAIDRISFAASTDEARAILTGVSLKAAGGVLEIAATDGFRLSVEKFPSVGGETSFSVVVPARVIQEILKVMRESSGDYAGNFTCALSKEGTQLIFTLSKDTLFMTRILEGTYPPYTKIIPTSYASRVLFETDLLLKTVRTAALFARSGASVVKMMVDNSAGVVRLSSATEQVGEYSGEIEAKIEGSNTAISFNSKYLLEFLGKVKSDQVALEMNGANQPGVWRIPSVLEYLHVIMPIKSDS